MVGDTEKRLIVQRVFRTFILESVALGAGASTFDDPAGPAIIIRSTFAISSRGVSGDLNTV
jgi:hypothetical protein